MSKMRINFLEEMSIRSKPPMTFEAFTKHIDNFYGLKEIGFSTDVLEYSYTDTSNKIQKFSNEEEYSQLMDVFNKGELDEVFVNLKGANTKKENKRINNERESEKKNHPVPPSEWGRVF